MVFNDVRRYLPKNVEIIKFFKKHESRDAIVNSTQFTFFP